MQKQKRRQQVAALPYWIDPDGKLKLLLVTSRDTGRWVLPKLLFEALPVAVTKFACEVELVCSQAKLSARFHLLNSGIWLC